MRGTLRKRLNQLYFGRSHEALRFQSVLILLDLVLVGFFIVAPFIERDSIFYVVDYLIAGVMALDLAARAFCFGNLRRWIARPIVWADFAVLASLVAPYFAANLGFLRVLRAYSLLHSENFWRIFRNGRWTNSPVRETAEAGTNLFVFIFMMSSLVHTLFAGRSTHIGSFVDSLYFTVTTLTTTGYGDIVLPGIQGRLLSIAIMIGGVSLFVRLIHVTMRARKVRHRCESCGLLRHDPDAVHCKACGAPVNIPHDND